MKISIAKIFHPVAADSVRRDQLFEAERLLVEHQAAAEMHNGLAGVYKVRIERIRHDLAHAVAHLKVAK